MRNASTQFLNTETILILASENRTFVPRSTNDTELINKRRKCVLTQEARNVH